MPKVAAKLKEPGTKDCKFEDAVKSGEKAPVLVLVMNRSPLQPSTEGRRRPRATEQTDFAGALGWIEQGKAGPHAGWAACVWHPGDLKAGAGYSCNSAFSIIFMPLRSTTLPLSVTVWAALAASSLFIGWWSPMTR